MPSRKITLMRSRRSFLAASKIIIGVGVSLVVAARSASAQPTPTLTPTPIPRPCFLQGTKIKTPNGEISIEELRIGDRILTVKGEAKQIKFIGRRREVWRESSQPRTGEGPVKISRFAIDGKGPHSDLYVSPWHAIYIDRWCPDPRQVFGQRDQHRR
jgi:hypothetical protein